MISREYGTRQRKVNNTLYKTKCWEKKRKRILKRDGYICQQSRRYGRTVSADTVHHIYPVEEYPELAYVNWNLISLSGSVHNRMHDRVTGDITELGKQWQERRRPEFERWLKEREKKEC